jgi:putative DNA primase/helicase
MSYNYNNKKLFDECLRYYKQENLNVIPLRYGDKRPIFEWAKFQKQKITDEEINSYFYQTKNNIGIVCGAISDNFFAIDFDSEGIFRKIVTKPDGKTIVETGREDKGYHVYGKAEFPVKTLKIHDSEGREVITLKGEGSYVVAPPSKHPSGRFYEFIQRGEIERLTGDPRQQLIELCEKIGLHAPKETINIEDLLKGVSEGNRDNSLLYLITFLKKSGISKDEAKKIIEKWNKRNKPPLIDIDYKVDYHYERDELYKYFFLHDPTKWRITEGLELKKIKEEKRSRKEKYEEMGAILDYLENKYRFVTFEDTEAVYYRIETGIYAPAEPIIKAEIETYFKEETTRYLVDEVIGHIKRRHYIQREQVNKDHNKLPFLNGVLNLNTLELEPFKDEDIFTYQVPHEYDLTIQIPEPIMNFIRDIIDEEDIPLLQQHSGSVFEPHNTWNKTLWLGGIGRNGKTQYCELIEIAVGKKNTSHVPIEQMNPNYRFALFRLYGKFFNPVSEPNVNYDFKTETFKRITGGDPIEGELKGVQRPVDFTPFVSIWVLGNRYPMPKDDSDAFWDRVDVIKFPRQFLGEERIPDIAEKLVKENGGERAIQGFINWCLEGLRYLREHNYQGTYSRTSEEMKIEFRRMSDTIGSFIQEMIILDPKQRYPQPELYAAYTEYCGQYSLTVMRKADFTTRIGQLRGVVLRRARWRGESKLCWIGLTLIEKREESEESGQILISPYENREDNNNKKRNNPHSYSQNSLCSPSTNNEELGNQTISDTHTTTDEALKPPEQEQIFKKCVCGFPCKDAEAYSIHIKRCEVFHAQQAIEARERLKQNQELLNGAAEGY